MLNYQKQRLKYIVSDIIAASIGWMLFFIFRKLFIEDIASYQFIEQVFKNKNFYIGTFLITIFWLLLYYLSGYYNYVYKKTIDREIFVTYKLTLIGTIIIFFTLLLDDQVRIYKNYYSNFLMLFLLHSTLTLIPRLIITYHKNKKIRQKLIYFNTLIIGCGERATTIYHELSQKSPTDGNLFLGYLVVNAERYKNNQLENYIPNLGSIENLPDVISKYHIDEIILAIEPEEQKDILNIISWLGYSEVSIKAIVGLHQVLKGHAKITNLLGTPLIEVEYELLPFWQQAIKSILDILISLVALILLSPLFIFCALGIKFTSKGPIFFKQERIGKNGKPFTLYKFRSMYVDAEKDGPNLSNPKDKRCTSFGKFLRQTKLDEIPNFINVLKGDMSLVGPRPERQYYIEQIIKTAPQYKQLQKIKPGITSLGQVRYGYATSVEQMVKRLRYDLLYLQNMSLYTDFLIIYLTIKILFKGRHF